MPSTIPIEGYQHIEKVAKRCGGVACIKNTRLPVWLFVEMRKLGFDMDEMARDYKIHKKEVWEEVWRYAEEFKAEVEADVPS